VLPFWGQDHQSWRLDSGDDSTKLVTAHWPGDAKLRQEDQYSAGSKLLTRASVAVLG
jgi:hypothetical protein